MRNAFADEIFQLAKADPRIVLLSGDIGNRLFDKFKAEMPDRFYNCGIAEANMISLAAGLAATGLRPLCYTITPFVTTRALEQIKLDVCYHEMPVTIVGTGSGLSYASLGSTHHSFEDIAILRPLPGLRILAPADRFETKACLKETFRQDKPTYIRIGKKGEPDVYDRDITFTEGKWQPLSTRNWVYEGGAFPKKVLLLGCGKAALTAQAIETLLHEKGIIANPISCASVKPLDETWLTKKGLEPYDLVVTLEDHSRIGGFGSAVAEYLCDQGTPHPRLLRTGIPDEFLHDCGEEEDARELCQTTASAITEKILQIVQSS